MTDDRVARDRSDFERIVHEKTTMAGNQGWSDELRRATKRVIEIKNLLPLGEGVPSKDIDRRFEVILLGDFLRGHLRLIDRRSREGIKFPDAEPLSPRLGD